MGDFSHYIHHTTRVKELMDHWRFKTDDCPIRDQVSNPWKPKDGSKRGRISGFVPLASCISFLVVVWLRRHGGMTYQNPHHHLMCFCSAAWRLPTSSHRIALPSLHSCHITELKWVTNVVFQSIVLHADAFPPMCTGVLSFVNGASF